MARIDLRHHVADPYILAFTKGDLLHLAIDTHFHGHGIVGLDRAESDARNREVLILHHTGRYGHGPGRRSIRGWFHDAGRNAFAP
jgi:hypothetical protein